MEAVIRTGIYAGVAFLTKGKALEVALRAGRDLAKIELRGSNHPAIQTTIQSRNSDQHIVSA